MMYGYIFFAICFLVLMIISGIVTCECVRSKDRFLNKLAYPTAALTIAILIPIIMALRDAFYGPFR